MSGKFDSPLTEFLWNITLNGFHQEECGTVDTGSWYGLIRFDYEPDDTDTLVPAGAVGAIVYCDKLGFVYSDVYMDTENLDTVWAAIVEECSTDEEE